MTMPSVESKSRPATYLSSLALKKRTWSPSTITNEVIVPGAEQTLARCLALRQLEVPVGEFVECATKKELKLEEGDLDLLTSNIEDESVHERALNNIIFGLPHLRVSQYEKEALEFLDAFLELDDHPICTARLIESSIFFIILPLMRFTGGVGIRTVAEDISRDEVVHTATNQHICQRIGTTYSKKADRLRREVVTWMTQDVGEFAPSISERHKNFSSQGYLLQQSDMLLTQGRSEMTETKAQRVLSPFEINKNNMPRYY
jgi:hypothetical protein